MADGMLDGIFDEETGEFIDDEESRKGGPGFPRSPTRDAREAKEAKFDRQTFNKLMRQLGERDKCVRLKQKKPQYYENKRQEFIKFIDDAIENHGFVMPPPGRRIHRIYHDKWN